MAKYLFATKYTREGVVGLLKDGGTSRRDAVVELVESLGGSVESFYFAFGDTDTYLIADLPTPEAAAAFALTVGAGGGAASRTTVLLTPEQGDAVRELSPRYRAPGA